MRGHGGKGERRLRTSPICNSKKLHRKNSSTQQHCWKTKQLVKARVWWNTKGHRISLTFHHALQLDVRRIELEGIILDDGNLSSSVYTEGLWQWAKKCWMNGGTLSPTLQVWCAQVRFFRNCHEDTVLVTEERENS